MTVRLSRQAGPSGGSSEGSAAGATSAPSAAAASSSSHLQLAETLAPSAWLSEVLPRKTPYFPQMGDEVGGRPKAGCVGFWCSLTTHRSWRVNCNDL